MSNLERISINYIDSEITFIKNRSVSDNLNLVIPLKSCANSFLNFVISASGHADALSVGGFNLNGTVIKLISEISCVRSGSFDTSDPRLILVENS